MRKLFLTLIALHVISLQAQNFENIYSGGYWAIDESYNGNYLLTGRFKDSDSTQRISILRINQFNGDIISETQYGIPGLSFNANFIFETADSSVYLTAISTIDSTDGDPIVIKLDVCGQPQWMRNLRTLICDGSDNNMNWVNYAVEGDNNSITMAIGFYPCGEYLINIAPDGNFNWLQNVSDAFEENYAGFSMARVDDGYIITGEYLAYREDEGEGSYSALLKFDNEGNFLWRDYYEYPALFSECRTLCDAWEPDSYFSLNDLVSGYFYMRTGNESDSLYTHTVTETVPPYFRGRKIYRYNQGEYIVAGEKFFSEVFCNPQYAVSRINTSGIMLDFGETNNIYTPFLRNSYLTSDLNMLMVGDFFDDDYEFNQSYLVKFNTDLDVSEKTDSLITTFPAMEICGLDSSWQYFDLTSILPEYYASMIEDEGQDNYEWGNINAHDLKKATTEIRSFPNPAFQQFTIQWPGIDGVDEIKFYNTAGTQTGYFPVNEMHSITIDVNNLMPGIYAYNIYSKGEIIYSGKVIVTHS